MSRNSEATPCVERLAVAIASLLIAAGASSAADGFWTTHGPAASDVRALALDPVAPATLYAGMANGVFKTIDAGTTWVATNLGGRSVTALAAAPGSTIYAGTLSGGVFKSADGGATWIAVIPEANGPPPVYTSPVILLQVDPLAPTSVYAGFSGIGPGGGPIGGFAKSTDGGSHWIDIQNGLPRPDTALAIDPQDSRLLYAGTSASGLFKSVDAGANWTQLNSALATTVIRALAIDPSTRTTIYAASGSQGLFKSIDGGSTFVAINSGLGGTEALALAVDRMRPSRLYAGLADGGVSVSTNAGESWNPINAGLTNLAVVALALDPTGSLLHAATFGGGVFEYQTAAAQDTLTLNPGHSFSIWLNARDQRTGRAGTGLAVSVNGIFGYFSIPDLTGNPGNPEVFVKVLDATSIGAGYWVFYGGLTDLEYALTVSEDATGRTKTYVKPAGSPCGGFDTEAFP